MDLILAEAKSAPANPVGLSQGAGMPRFIALAKTIYNYVLGMEGGGIGIGAEDMALSQPTTFVIDSIYAPRYNVRGTLAPLEGGQLIYAQQLVPVDLQGHGDYFHGTMGFGALSTDGNIPNNIVGNG